MWLEIVIAPASCVISVAILPFAACFAAACEKAEKLGTAADACGCACACGDGCGDGCAPSEQPSPEGPAEQPKKDAPAAAWRAGVRRWRWRDLDVARVGGPGGDTPHRSVQGQALN